MVVDVRDAVADCVLEGVPDRVRVGVEAMVTVAVDDDDRVDDDDLDEVRVVVRERVAVDERDADFVDVEERDAVRVDEGERVNDPERVAEEVRDCVRVEEDVRVLDDVFVDEAVADCVETDECVAVEVRVRELVFDRVPVSELVFDRVPVCERETAQKCDGRGASDSTVSHIQLARVYTRGRRRCCGAGRPEASYRREACTLGHREAGRSVEHKEGRSRAGQSVIGVDRCGVSDNPRPRSVEEGRRVAASNREVVPGGGVGVGPMAVDHRSRERICGEVECSCVEGSVRRCRGVVNVL